MTTFLINQNTITEQRAEESRRMALKLVTNNHKREVDRCLEAWVNRANQENTTSQGAQQ